MGNKSFLFERWPRYAFRHAWSVLAGTFLVLIVLGAVYLAGAGTYADAFSIPGVESQRLFDLLEQRFPATAGDAVTVAVKAPRGVNDPGVKPQVLDLERRLAALPEVVEVSSPYDSPDAISPDGAVARITVQYDKRATAVSKSSTETLLDLRREVSRADFQVEAGGIIVQRAEREPPGSSELIGISAAVVILLLAFGSVVAMGMPIATALLGLSSGFFLVGVGAAFVDLPSFTPEFTAMIGIGVGIDYALLVVNRFREALARGMSPEDATVKAAGTAGRSVFFAGGTVVIALLGLWASGTPAVGWLGTAAALVVALSVMVALVVLPAILSLAGPHINRWRIPGLAPAGIDDEAGVGYRLSRMVQRAPLLFMLVSLGFLLVLTVPVLDIRLGISDAGNNPQSFTSRRAYDLISQGFGPGMNGRIVVGLQIDDQSALPQVKQLPATLKGITGVQAVSPVRFNGDQSAATVTVTPTSAPQDSETVDLVHNLRTTLHQQFAGTGATPLVGGSTALTIDLSDRNTSRLPYFLGAVIALSFLLLMAVFRSIAVPIKAAAMNLLSIGASFGVLVAIFQWGWLGSIVGVNRDGPVEAFLPMMLFAVLFGLSMDYEVFLVSRIREEYLETLDNTEAVARGLSVTTRVITAAAGIMVAVFIAFAASDQRVVKEFGIGLATAIFLDATVVRLVLVPSLMQLMGKWNWWLPGWLDRILPRLSVDPPPSRTTKPAVEPGLAARD